MTISDGSLFPQAKLMAGNIARVPLALQLFFFVVGGILAGWPPTVAADVVKPALVELTINDDSSIRLEVRASIEAMLADISTRYKNTQDAPTAAEYDRYRAMMPLELRQVFAAFEPEFLDAISLRFDGRKAALKIESVEIPEPGYKKVPRISVITMSGRIPEGVGHFVWRYPERFGDAAFRFRHFDASEYTWSDWRWLRNGEPTPEIGIRADYVKRPFADVVWSYMKLGFLHIVPRGVDHILFILGLFLLSIQLRPLLLQATAFTVAHTITLGLSMYGFIEMPARILEPLIALSIAYVGFENIFFPRLHSSRLVIVFLFGLLHGLGFASVLADFGMPKNDFATALISFNVGVEFGQIALLLGAWLLLALPFRHNPRFRQLIVIPGSAMIAVVGLIWMVDRIVNG